MFYRGHLQYKRNPFTPYWKVRFREVFFYRFSPVPMYGNTFTFPTGFTEHSPLLTPSRGRLWSANEMENPGPWNIKVRDPSHCEPRGRGWNIYVALTRTSSTHILTVLPGPQTNAADEGQDPPTILLRPPSLPPVVCPSKCGAERKKQNTRKGGKTALQWSKRRSFLREAAGKITSAELPHKKNDRGTRWQLFRPL